MSRQVLDDLDATCFRVAHIASAPCGVGAEERVDAVLAWMDANDYDVAPVSDTSPTLLCHRRDLREAPPHSTIAGFGRAAEPGCRVDSTLGLRDRRHRGLAGRPL